MKYKKHIKSFNEETQDINTNSLNDMTFSEIKKFIKNNFVATKSNIKDLVDATKNLTQKEMMYVSYSLGHTAGALYCLIMENKYGIKVSI